MTVVQTGGEVSIYSMGQMLLDSESGMEFEDNILHEKNHVILQPSENTQSQAKEKMKKQTCQKPGNRGANR